LIDGRSSTDIGPYGSREMPALGNTRIERFNQAGGNPQLAQDAARRRILDLVNHLERLATSRCQREVSDVDICEAPIE